jgi:hypothetical protein
MLLVPPKGRINELRKHMNTNGRAYCTRQEMSGRGLSSDILKEAEKFAKENGASVMLTSAGN